METVIVIGGGASGMLAALTAAEASRRRVLLLERQQRPGRKLLSTGNGRCNLTNIGASPENYHGNDRSFAAPALEKFGSADALEFFSSLGLVTVSAYGGRVYPLSDSANSVLDVLRFELTRRGVELRCSCPARELRRAKGGFAVMTDEGELSADYVIAACGGAAGAKLGGVMDGYELLKPLGHKRTALYPALTQIICDSPYPRSLKGVRADCALRLLRGDKLAAQSRGELQFTDTGVSGPAAFDVSRAASTGGAGLSLSCNFLADHGIDQVLDMLKARRERLPDIEAGELFTGIIHNRLGRMIVKFAAINNSVAVGSLSDAELLRAAKAACGLILPVRGVEGFAGAQITAGGLDTAFFHPETLESRLIPRLFACGELLDIDGDCGGYNLQWAWSSGRLAGRLGG